MSAVKVLVYDLSRGLAMQMSEAILGQRIDGIWHTGILVFGYEYFFGGGIQCLSEGSFSAQNSLPVARVHDIGLTEKTKDEFETYLRSINHLYTQQTYNLISHNCNNFSDIVSRFLTGQGIPSYIVDLPRTVFSSPGGMALRPIFENMQNSIQAVNAGSDPFGQYGDSSRFSSSTLANVSLSVNGESSTNVITTQSAITESARRSERTLSKYEVNPSPLLSADCDDRVIDSMFKKIINIKPSETSSVPILSEQDALILTSVIKSVKDKTVSSIPSEAYRILTHIAATQPNLQLACLFLLRLIVLYPPASNDQSTTDLNAFIQEKILKGESEFTGIPAFVMGLCTVSNMLTTTHLSSVLLSNEERLSRLLDLVMSLLSHSRVEVRQIASAILVNLTYAYTSVEEGGWGRMTSTLTEATPSIPGAGDEVAAPAVQVLCGALEGVGEEPDGVCRLRRLTAAARVLRGCGQAAVTLACDLGFASSVSELAKGNIVATGEADILSDLVLILA